MRAVFSVSVLGVATAVRMSRSALRTRGGAEKAAALVDLQDLQTGPGTSALLAGQTLEAEQFLTSADGACHAFLRGDGSFCVKKGPSPSVKKFDPSEKDPDIMWCSMPAGSDSAEAQYSAFLQENGRLGVFQKQDHAVSGSKPLWESNHDCSPGENKAPYFLLHLYSTGRLSIIRKVGEGATGREVWNNGLGHSPAQRPRYIFFERDTAGFNNIKMQLQAMVAVAAVTGRTLVLPPPKHEDHLEQDYYEFEFFDAAKLMSVIDIALSGEPDDQTITVGEHVSDVHFRKLDQDKDWFFPLVPSRIQHFECLNLGNYDRAVASNAIINGLVFDHHLEEMASSALQRLNLSSGNATEDESQDGGFDCVHIRRGDFATYAPLYELNDTNLSTTLRRMLPGRPLLVLSDETPQLDLGSTAVKYARDAYIEDISNQTRIAVDMIMCSRARDFVGTPLSTFTNGILELRRRNTVLNGAPDTPAKLFVGDFMKGSCWDRATTFDGVKLCEKGESHCFANFTRCGALQ